MGKNRGKELRKSFLEKEVINQGSDSKPIKANGKPCSNI